MTEYNGILVRQNLTDQGIIPRTGGWTASPDVIAAGVTPIANPEEVFATESSYKTDPTEPMVEKAANYIYLRGKNLSTTPVTGTARVFYAPHSLFLYPQQWINNPLKTSQGAESSKIENLDAQAIGVTSDPFSFIPTDTSEHHCLMGFISSPEYPFETQKPPNAVTSLKELSEWVAQHGGTGWHNVQFTSADSPTFTNSTHYPASSTLAKLHFNITCTGCPVGSHVSFSCGTPLPNGKVISFPKTEVNTTETVGYFVEVDVPAGWESDITYSYWEGGTPLANFNVSMSASIVTNNEPTLKKYGRLATDVFPNHTLHCLETNTLKNDMPVNYIIPCGSDTTLIGNK